MNATLTTTSTPRTAGAKAARRRRLTAEAGAAPVVTAAPVTERRFVLLGNYVRIKGARFNGWTGPIEAWNEDGSQVKVRWSITLSGEGGTIWLKGDEFEPLAVEWKREELALLQFLHKRYDGLWDAAYEMWSSEPLHDVLHARCDRVTALMRMIRREVTKSSALVVYTGGAES